MKKFILAGAGVAFCILALIVVGVYLVASSGLYDHSGYFKTAGDEEYLDVLMSGANSEDWHAFFESTAAEGNVLSISAEKQRYIQGLADPDSGDYNMGAVHLKLILTDLRNGQEIINKTFEQPLPTVVIKQGGESAQEAAYAKAERELKKLLKIRMQALVYPAMTNYPGNRDDFLPIMEKRVNDSEVTIKYSAGRALLGYGDAAVPALVRAAFADEGNSIVCGRLVQELKDVSQESVPELEKLLTHPGKEVRGGAIMALTPLMGKNDAARQAVMSSVKGTDHYVQKSVLTALQKMGTEAGKTPTTFPLLSELMLNGKQGNNWQASKALCAMGKAAYPTLMGALDHKQLHNQLKGDLVRETPEAQRDALFPFLAETLQGGTPNQKAGAKLVLTTWSQGGGKYFNRAIATASSSEKRVHRDVAVKQMVEIINLKTSGRRSRPIEKDDAETLALFLADKDPGIQKTALDALVAARYTTGAYPVRDRAYILSLKTAPSDSKNTMALLSKVSSRSLRKKDLPLFFRLTKSKDSAVSQRALNLLMGQHELADDVLPVLTKQLAQMPYDTRYNTIRKLCQRENAGDYVPAIFNAAWDPVSKKYINITSLLYRVPISAGHIPVIREMLAGDTHERVKRGIIQLLKNTPSGGASETEFLTDLLKSGKLAGQNLEGDLLSFFKQRGDAGLEGAIYCFGGSPHTRSGVYQYLRTQDKAKTAPLLKKINARTKNPDIKNATGKVLAKM